jgi:hypothetical protein
VSWPVCSEVRLAKLDEWEFDPPKELTEGVLGIPFVIGAGEVAVLTLAGSSPASPTWCWTSGRPSSA